ncbi:hypothetical protein SAMD00019534_060730, partial [Acytostelium subglobosum LB1]|uniref:hypothetical protein n=1 Tax=Acytostelium subglobosum LB1 TaxID=1410327 RepID=UPI0006447C31
MSINNISNNTLYPSRDMGFMERYQLSKQTADVYGKLCLLCQLTIQTPLSPGQTINQEYLVAILQPAITELCQEIPSMTLVVSDIASNKPSFSNISSFDLLQVLKVTHNVDFGDQDALQLHLANEVSSDFDLRDQSVPLWNLHVLVDDRRPNELVIIWSVHHLISDGVSTSILWTHLLRCINDTSSSSTSSTSTSTIIAPTSVPPLQPPFDKRTPHHPTITDLVPVLFKELLLPSFIKRWTDTTYWAGETHAVRAHHQTLVELVQLEDDLVERLNVACKKEDTTIHAALCVAAVASLLETLGGDASTTAIKTCTPISARKYCEPPVSIEEVGNFVAAFDKVWQMPLTSLKEKFWQQCREYKTQLAGNSINDVKMVNMLKYVGENPAKWDDFWWSREHKLPMGRSGSIELSDLGKWNLVQKQDDQWKAQSAVFAQSSNVYGSVLSFNCVSLNGRLRPSITWQPGVISQDKVKEVSKLLSSTLSELANKVTE